MIAFGYLKNIDDTVKKNQPLFTIEEMKMETLPAVSRDYHCFKRFCCETDCAERAIACGGRGCSGRDWFVK